MNNLTLSIKCNFNRVVPIWSTEHAMHATLFCVNVKVLYSKTAENCYSIFVFKFRVDLHQHYHTLLHCTYVTVKIQETLKAGFIFS
uniref:Uncharacterized protein n=1 Tax=Anguilla anguilla TaxID=7936 RepID=A0A0E9RN12_ANGAN